MDVETYYRAKGNYHPGTHLQTVELMALCRYENLTSEPAGHSNEERKNDVGYLYEEK